MEKLLSLNDYVSIEGLKEHGYIDTIRQSGPLGKCTMSLKKVIMLMEHGHKPEFSRKTLSSIYNFVMIYNKQIDETNSDCPKLLNSQSYLESRMDVVMKKEDDEINPFIDPDEIALRYRIDEVFLNCPENSANKYGLINPLGDTIDKSKSQKKDTLAHVLRSIMKSIELPILQYEIDDIYYKTVYEEEMI